LEINEETHVPKIIVPEEEKKILFEHFCMIIFAVQIGWMDLFGWVSYSGLIRLIGRIGWMNHFDLLHHLYLIGSV